MKEDQIHDQVKRTIVAHLAACEPCTLEELMEEIKVQCQIEQTSQLLPAAINAVQVIKNSEYVQYTEKSDKMFPSGLYQTLSWSQMEAFQASINLGFEFKKNFEETMLALVDRIERLEREAQQSDAGELQYPYCNSGLVDKNCIWYESTSGTILGQSPSRFFVIIPKERAGLFRRHRKELEYVLSGMSLEQYHLWYNSYLFEDETDPLYPRYRELVEWHYLHMVPKGYEPLESAESIIQRRQERHAKLMAAYKEEECEDYEDYDADYDYDYDAAFNDEDDDEDELE